MGLGGVAIAVLPSMIYPKQPFSDGLGGHILPKTLSRCTPKDGADQGLKMEE